MSELLLLIALLSARGHGATAQPPLELSFSRVAAKPGDSAALPIYILSDENYRQPFQVTLEFSARDLTFRKVERAYLAERANWTVSASVKPHPDKPDRRILRVELVPGESNFFPSGAVAHAHFLVSKSAKAGAITLDAALQLAGTAGPIPPADPAKIIVFTTPVFGCFFYMH